MYGKSGMEFQLKEQKNIGELNRYSGELSQFSGELSQYSGELSQYSGELSRYSGELSRFSYDFSENSAIFCKKKEAQRLFRLKRLLYFIYLNE